MLPCMYQGSPLLCLAALLPGHSLSPCMLKLHQMCLAKNIYLIINSEIFFIDETYKVQMATHQLKL